MHLHRSCMAAMFSPKLIFSSIQATSAAPPIHLLLQPLGVRSTAIAFAPQFCHRNGGFKSSSALGGFQDLALKQRQPHPSVVRLTFATASQNGNEIWTGETGEVAKPSPRKTDLQVVLVSPQIPGNTGCIARSCAAAAVGLHLVEPLGFEISSAKLKRAGLDYWPYVVVNVHKSWVEFFEYFQQQEGKKRLLGFTKKGSLPHTVVKYRPGDWLLFGSETEGLPDAAVEECRSNTHGGGLVRIPIDETYVRCLNLSVAAGIGIYEALRQLGYAENMTQTPASNSVSTGREDIFC